MPSSGEVLCSVCGAFIEFTISNKQNTQFFAFFAFVLVLMKKLYVAFALSTNVTLFFINKSK